MSSSILVAFATSSGSTQEVAEAIAAAMQEAGESVACRAARDVRSLEGYRAVVLGAPFYMYRWHKDARGFLARHRTALPALPVAVFALGPFNDKEEEWEGVRSELAKEMARYPWLKPVTTQVFGGKFDPATLRFPYNLVPGMKRMPVNDIRDWVAIKDWAVSLVEQFGTQAG